MSVLKDYTSLTLNGQGASGTLAGLEAALKDMTPERWDWHNEEDDAKRSELEAYWNKCENELIAITIKEEANGPARKVAVDLYNKYAPPKHYQTLDLA